MGRHGVHESRRSNPGEVVLVVEARTFRTLSKKDREGY